MLHLAESRTDTLMFGDRITEIVPVRLVGPGPNIRVLPVQNDGTPCPSPITVPDKPGERHVKWDAEFQTCPVAVTGHLLDSLTKALEGFDRWLDDSKMELHAPELHNFIITEPSPGAFANSDELIDRTRETRHIKPGSEIQAMLEPALHILTFKPDIDSWVKTQPKLGEPTAFNNLGAVVNRFAVEEDRALFVEKGMRLVSAFYNVSDQLKRAGAEDIAEELEVDMWSESPRQWAFEALEADFTATRPASWPSEQVMAQFDNIIESSRTDPYGLMSRDTDAVLDASRLDEKLTYSLRVMYPTVLGGMVPSERRPTPVNSFGR